MEVVLANIFFYWMRFYAKYHKLTDVVFGIYKFCDVSILETHTV